MNNNRIANKHQFFAPLAKAKAEIIVLMVEKNVWIKASYTLKCFASNEQGGSRQDRHLTIAIRPTGRHPFVARQKHARVFHPGSTRRV